MIMTEEVQTTDVKGVNPGVQQGDLADYQKTDMKDAGIPRAPAMDDRAKKENDEHAEEVAENFIPAEKQDEVKQEPSNEQPEAQTPEKQEDVPEDAEYMSYGHPGADAAVELLKEAGIKAVDAAKWFAKAAESRNLDDIDVGAIEAAVGKAKAQLVVGAVRDYLGGHNQTVDRTVAAVYEELGGEDNFVKARDFLQKKAEVNKDLRGKLDELNKMFDIGENSARMAARELLKMYEEDSTTSSLKVSITSGDSPVNKSEYISRADFITKLKAAEDKGNFAEADRLRKLRLASKNRE